MKKRILLLLLVSLFLSPITRPSSADELLPILTGLPLCIPERIVIESLNINQAIEPSDNDEVINPSSWWDVLWWTGGGCPSSTPHNSENLTTYLFGHASNNLKRKVIFDDLKHMESGDEITILTDIGDFNYRVEEVFILEKPDFLTDGRVTLNREGRLLLVSCWTKEKYNRRAAKHNIVVVANLKTLKTLSPLAGLLFL